MPAAIEMSDVWFAYDGRNYVLEDVNLRIAADETVAVVGPNGGGKTTLLRLALGLAVPTRGRVHVFSRPPADARPLVGYVPQHMQFDVKFPVTAWDVVLMGRLGRGRRIGFFGRADRKAASAALDQVGLAALKNRSFAEMSGGQRQRVLIARALAAQPQLLLLDEPTANLDISMEQEFHDLLAKLSGRMAVVIVSHDVGFVSSRISKVVCVRTRVAVHSTRSLSGELLGELYGRDISVVQHHTHVEPGPPAPDEGGRL